MAAGEGNGELQTEYSQLKAEHAQLEEQITKLEKCRFHTPEDEIQIKKLKKKKLSLKDQMQRFLQKSH